MRLQLNRNLKEEQKNVKEEELFVRSLSNFK
jgi:hypothetical protein